MNVRKKDGSYEPFRESSIINAVKKSAARVNIVVSEADLEKIASNVRELSYNYIEVELIHKMVEIELYKFNPLIADSYRSYRNYKTSFIGMIDNVMKTKMELDYRGDRENANADSAFVSTKRSLIYKTLNKELYKNFFLSNTEKRAIKEGQIYIHDLGDRLDTFNCCLFNMSAVLDGGFELANMHYNEPNTLAVAFDVISDITLAAAAQQYGGFTIPEVDKVLLKYARKSFDKYIQDYYEITETENYDKAYQYAIKKITRDAEQGFQSWEYKFNTLASSRGDYPFITITLGLSQDELGIILNKAALKVRKEGQGAKGKKRPVLFPKIVFLYDEALHGEGCVLEEVFESAIDCSSKALYPDFLSLTGDGYVADIYKEYGEVISPMGCRAFLSPYWKDGGQIKGHDQDVPLYLGRANAGAISLHLPLIYAKAKDEGIDFYSLLEHYLLMIRDIHMKTKDYLSKLKASVNPLAFTEGGLLYGTLSPDDSIAPVLDHMTFSFGITALAELQRLYNGKSLVEDGEFAYEVLEYIKNYVDKAKIEDNILYAVYSTPAESLSHTQAKQFRNQCGVIPMVSDKEYLTNSFHMPVWEDITPIEKQDLEYRYFHLSTGGRIQYCRYPNGDNKKAIKTIVRRAMKMGFYEGINIEKNYCDDCGAQFEDGEKKCPNCFSSNITQINRVCGYIGYSKVNGSSRINDGKMAEIKDRVSM